MEHFIYSREPAFGTWTTPARWLHVENADIQSTRPNIKLPMTGFGRALGFSVLGSKPVPGQVVTPWWPTDMATLINTFLTDLATTNIEAGVDDQAMLPDDTAVLESISAQMQHSTTLARNVLGGVVSRATLSLTPGQNPVRWTFDIEAKDDAIAGSPWAWDNGAGGNSAAVIATPNYDPLIRYFTPYDVTIMIGGTPAFNDTTNKISISGGTAHSLLASLQIVFDNGLHADGFGLAPDPTRQEIVPQARTVTVNLDRSWTDYNVTLANAWRAGTTLALGVDISGPAIGVTGEFYQAHIHIPSLLLDEAKHPALSGDQNKRMIRGAGQALVASATIPYDVGVWVRTSEATI